MKKGIASLLTVLMLVVLSACGQGTNNGNTSSPGKGTDTATESSGEQVTLKIGSWRTEDKAAYEEAAKKFTEKYPNIKVEFAPTKNTEYNTVLNTELMTGEGPDIIHLRPYVAGQQIADSDYLVELDGLQGLDQIPKELLIAAKGSDGKVYGAPILKNSIQVLYNKKMFDDLKLTEPKTWDEMIQVAETLKQNDVVPFAFGAKEGWILSLVHGGIGPVGYGGNDFVNKITKGQIGFDSEEFTQSVQLLQELIPYYPNNFEGISMDDMRNMLVTEQAGMMIMGDWEVTVIRGMNPDLQLDAFPIPTKEGNPIVATWVDGSFAVNKNSKHQEEAKKFIEFALTEEFGTIISNRLLRQSTLPAVQNEDALMKKISNFANDESAVTPYLFNVYFAAGNPSSKLALETALQGMLLQKLKPADVGVQVKESVDTWFKPLN
ncbi:ABC transporter substrate-binding protein [Paenibacillus sp. NPDC057967]|uniref:ABC transporter substrate-binding protein n=1 Tax=Paenibacillus sp. NPDC057967 TaxID=3346293 RepID=UPI0036D92502